MTFSVLFVVLIVVSALAYLLGQRAALAAGRGATAAPRLHSLPSYYGLLVALWCGLPSILLLGIWIALQDSILRTLMVGGLPPALAQLPPDQLNLLITDIRNLAAGTIASREATPEIAAAVAHYLQLRATGQAAMWVAVLAIGIAGMVHALRLVKPEYRARNVVEKIINVLLIIASTVAVFTTIGIVLSMVFEAARFFARVPAHEFLFGTTWSPQTAIRADQVGSTGAFGAVPLFTGTLLISAIAMLTAVPVGLMSAIYMSEYAPQSVRSVVKPILEILAGIPTVVYGFFAALTVAPAVAQIFGALGFSVSAQSALAAGLVMGVMIIPFVSSLSDDVINAVPNSLREGSYGLGATRAETIKSVLLPAALPGIMASVILAFSRALGETMIVVMAAGLAANITINPLRDVTTVTVHIAALLVGDQEFDSAKTLSAFALGLVLFVVTLSLNVFALQLVKKYRERYD